MKKQNVMRVVFRLLCMSTIVIVHSAYSMEGEAPELVKPGIQKVSEVVQSGAQFFVTDPVRRETGNGNSRAEQLRRVRQGLQSDGPREQRGNPYRIASTQEVIVDGVKEQCRECQRQCLDCCCNLRAQTMSFLRLCFRSCNYCVDHVNYYVIDDRDPLMSYSDSE